MGQQNKSTFSLQNLSEIGFVCFMREEVFSAKTPLRAPVRPGNPSLAESCQPRAVQGEVAACSVREPVSPGPGRVTGWSGCGAALGSPQTNLRNIPGPAGRPDPASVPVSSHPPWSSLRRVPRGHLRAAGICLGSSFPAA